MLRCQNALDWVRNFGKRICVSWGEWGGPGEERRAGRKKQLEEKLQFVVADITVLHRSFFFFLIFFFSFLCVVGGGVVVVVVCGLFAGHLDLVEFGAPVREIAGWVRGIDDISASMSLTSISFLIISSRLAQSPSSSGCNEIDEVGFSLLLLLQQQHLQQQLLLFFRSCSCLVHARILHTSLDSNTPNPKFLQILAPIHSQIPEIPSHIHVIQPRNGMCFVRFSDVFGFDLD